jgi:spore germination cell wall hydrolase CwlJ-like protein
MTPNDFTTSIIALACWRAARTELHSVMLAVCQTFMNRARAIQQDIYRVAASYIDENPDGDFPDIRDPQFQNLISKIESVLDGRVPDKTDGALWFVSKDKLTPDLLKPFTRTAEIGQMIFCK